ncbi:MAG: tryptophan halogenase family protein [Maricaulaceae bacterium]
MTENIPMGMQPIKTIVIVGGGTAGWMSAAALSKYLNKMDVSLTLIESDQIATVGVGEATIPAIGKFNRALGIDEDEFLKATQGTFKLGIEFENWGEIGERYFHPFGTYGFDLEGLDFHHFWTYMNLKGKTSSLDHYSVSARSAYDHKFIRPDPKHGAIINRLEYAFHFDAVLYAAYLRKFAESRGVKRCEGLVERVALDTEKGSINAVHLQDGRMFEADLYIDCTGFRGVLIEQALQTGYVDWHKYLPVDRAVVATTRKEDGLRPYTRSTAYDAGWQWHIPLQQRDGNGYVYCSEYLDAERAEQDFRSRLTGDLLKDPHHLRFVTGHRKKFWNKNCVAIGLSAGFMEPLESTSIHMIQSGISKLIALFPNRDMSLSASDEYNRLMRDDFTHIRDFLILHYKATRRDDSPFWNYVRTMEIPDSLQNKMELLIEQGRFFKYDAELFDLTSWLAVAAGQGFAPETYNPLVAGLSDENIEQSLSNMQSAIDKAVNAMPKHQDFIERYCKAGVSHG